MKKILKGIAVLAAVLVLAIVGLYILTMQPSAPTPELPAPQDREEAWRQDIAFLRDEFLKVDRSFTEETSQEFLDILNRLHDQVPSLSDNRIILEITRAVAKSGNAHTRAYLMRNGNYLRRFPIRFNWFSDGLYVVRATEEYASTLGARVLAINNKTPEELRKALRDFVPGSDSWVVYKSTYLLNSPEFLNGMNVVTRVDSIPITFEIKNDMKLTLKIAALPLSERPAPYEAWRDLSPLSAGNSDGNTWLHVLSKENLPLYLRRPDQNCSYEYLKNKNALYIQINRNESDETCSQSGFARKIKSLAESLSPASIIFDVRFNTGGSYEETFDLAKGIPAWYDAPKNIYILTGPATFSAGITTASWLKYYAKERAVIVGEPAGEGLRMWSEGPTFMLPNSKLKIKAATAFHDFAQANFEFGKTFFKDILYAVPAGDIDVDLPVSVSFQEYLSGHDPVLEEIFSQHENPRAAIGGVVSRFNLGDGDSL